MNTSMPATTDSGALPSLFSDVKSDTKLASIASGVPSPAVSDPPLDKNLPKDIGGMYEKFPVSASIGVPITLTSR